MGSRVLGLLRDALTAAFLGVSIASNAFIFAFMVPNLFRRLFGEGALTSAFVPVLSDHAKTGDDARAFRFVNQVLLRLALVTVGVGIALALLFFVATLAIAAIWGEGDTWSKPIAEQWHFGSWMSILMMPYLPMICLTAILGAVLNVRNRFAVPALSNVLLNVGMITALLVGGVAMKLQPEDLAVLLAVGVLAGGVLQLLTALIALWREGWRPHIERGPIDGGGELMRLFIPGLWGAAILQVNTFISRLLAFGLNETATTTLNYAHRLIELPMGVFAVAIATVIFPQMSLMVASGDRNGLVESYGHGLRMTLALTMPAAVGLIVLNRPIIQLLFEWGRFNAGDVALTGPLLMILAVGVPLFAINAFMTRAFHAFKDTRTPVAYAGVCFSVNVVASLALMFSLEAKGLALANVLSSIVLTILMVRGLRRKRPDLAKANVGAALRVIVLSAMGMAAVAFGIAELVEALLGPGKNASILICATAIPLGAGVYFALLFAFKFEDSAEVGKLIGRLVRRG